MEAPRGATRVRGPKTKKPLGGGFRQGPPSLSRYGARDQRQGRLPDISRSGNGSVSGVVYWPPEGALGTQLTGPFSHGAPGIQRGIGLTPCSDSLSLSRWPTFLFKVFGTGYSVAGYIPQREETVKSESVPKFVGGGKEVMRHDSADAPQEGEHEVRPYVFPRFIVVGANPSGLSPSGRSLVFALVASHCRAIAHQHKMEPSLKPGQVRVAIPRLYQTGGQRLSSLRCTAASAPLPRPLGDGAKAPWRGGWAFLRIQEKRVRPHTPDPTPVGRAP